MKKINKILLSFSAVFFLVSCSATGAWTRMYSPKEAYPPAGTTYTIDVLRENDSFYKIGNAASTPFLGYGWYRSIPAIVTDWDVIGVDDTELGTGHDTGVIAYQITFVALNTLFSYDGGTGTYQLINDLTGNDIFDQSSAVANDTPNTYSPVREYVFALQVSNRSLETISVTSGVGITTNYNYFNVAGFDYPDGVGMPPLNIDTLTMLNNFGINNNASTLPPYETRVFYIQYVVGGGTISGASPITFTITRLGVSLDGLYADMYDAFTSEGYSNGYPAGVSDGQAVAGGITTVWDIFTQGIAVIDDLMKVETLPGITIGMFIAVPLVFALLFWVIDELRNR